MEGDEKLIADLVERIGNMVVIQSLNQGSRSSHEEVKQDGLRKQAEEALLELSASKINIVVGALLTATESLPKQYKLEANADESEHAAFAQAKTYMLHLLGRTMAAAWDFIKRQFKNVEGLDEKEKVQLKQKEEQILPPPLEDELAKRVLDIAWHILLRPNPASAELKATAGKILFQLSASNYENVANKIDLSSAADENTSPLCLIEYLNVNAAHLSNLLQKVTSAAKAGAYKKDHQKTLLSRVLTKAIWSWIDHYPMEFVNLCQSGSRLDGEPDELFDIFAGWSGKNKKGQFWQLQTMLLILCPDIMLQVSLKKGKPKDGGHKDKFMNDLNKALKGKLADVSVVCYVDICKASTFVSKQDMSALRYIIPSIETELKERLFNPERPFQMSGGDEVQLMTDCLIATFRLSPRKVVNSLFTDFLSKEFPPVFKLVLVNTLQRIVDEGQSLPWTPTIADAYSGIAHQLRTLFQDLVNHTSAYDELRRQNDKNAKKQIEKVGYEMSIDILRRVIVLFNSDPTLALFPKDKSDVEAIRNLLTGLCTCASFFSLPELSVAASEALVALHKPENIARWCSSDVINGFWDISSAVNISIATVLAEREDLEINDSRQLIGVLKQILELRNEFLAKHKDAQPTSGEHSNTKAQSSKSLEVALLIHLCSSETEIVSKVETCFGLLCDEVDILGETDSENTIVANYVTYRKLASTSVMFTGRAAQQRAIRVELRRIRATPGNLQAWQLVEKRWSRLTHLILKAEEQRLAEQANAVKKTAKTVKAGKALKVPKQSTAPALSIPNDIIVEWNHYSGFLCAAAGVCTTKSTLPVEQSRKVSTESKVKHLEKFISQLLELIVSPSDVVRETSTELTGSTLSPAAYSDLFYQLHARVQQFFGGAGQVNFGEDANKFVDQAISIIKHILELPQDTHTADDLALITDFEPLMENLIKYVSQLVSKDNPTLPLRIKGKLCACLEAMMGKIQCIPFNNEFAFRQNVVEIIMEWISDFSAKPKSYSKQPILVDLSPEKKKEFEKAAQDVDIAAIKAIASLLRGLTLSKDEREEAETSTLGKYFTFFTRLLTRAKSEQSGSPQQVKADISVVALSNLLSTNIDSALDYFTTMGYHEDLETRAAFLKVLTNILNQGTQFELPEEGERYDKLVELLLDKKLDVVLALCNAIQITEADEAAKILVRFFEANEKTMLLLKKTIEQEVKRTETENTLFRRNSMATKVLAAYTKLIGTRYLKATLSPVIHNLVSNPLNLELDPQKLPEGQKREQNIENVTVVATDFLNAIIQSVDSCPLPLREICHFLGESVNKRFPGWGHSAIGGFIYLRFLCPAIVAPDGYGLIQSSVLTPELRRGLVLTTKVLQNLANKVMFTKEPYMEEMNAFLKQHMDTISEIFDRFATIPDKSKVPPYPVIHVSEEQREEDLANLHIHLSANLEKIKKYLSGPEHKKRGQTTILRLTTLLSQLGPPPEPTKKVFTAGPARSLPSGMKGVNARHAQFMSDHAKLDTKAIEERKLFYKHGFTNDKQPVFYYIARRFDATEVGQYPLLYHIMKTMQPELDKKYVIVIDCTLFDVEHEVPFAWINKFRQVAPSFQGLTNVYFINANHTFKKYSKRIAKVVSRARNKMTFLSSVKELAKVIPEKELGIPPSTVAVEKDVKATFSPVQKIMQYTNQKEVIIRISNNLFAVITTKQHCIFDKRVAMVDLYHISNIREINLSPDDNELIIKYDTKSQKTNLTFKCENANRIILALKASKARWDLSKPDTLHTSKRSFRASEVPGTLLNMALLNLGNPNAVLRVEAYNLLTALCSSRLSAPIALWETAGLCIPRNTTNFTVTLSQRLAQTEPDITLEFLMEALHGMEKIKENLPGKQLCLSYMSHWISNLRLFCAPTNQPDSTVKIEKTTQIIKSFIEFTIKEAGITGPAIQEKIWEVFGNVPEILDLTIDCLLERAEQKKQGTALSVIGDMFVSMASCSPGLVAGKVIARLMKVLDSSKNGPVSRLDEHALWKKIVVLLRVLLMLSFSNLLHVQQFLPELLFSILLLFSTGPSFVRATVHGLFINVVQSLYTALLSPDNKLQPLRLLLSELNRQEMRVLFGLGGSPVSPFSKPSDDSESLSSAAPLSITTVETVATKLFSVLGACSADDSPWHARLLSLTTRTAYTPNPALQPRAIIALGVLCNTSSLVTDDLIYQVLRTLRDVLGTPGQRLDHDLPLSLVICLTRLLEHLSPSSRFFKPMFWVAIILLEIDDCKLFGVAIGLLEAVLKTMDLHECLDDGITSYCLACREECGLEAILTKADQVTGISFKTSFSFAVSAHLLKGLRTPATKTATARVLSTFVDIAAKKGLGTNVLGYLAALLPVKGDDMDHLRNLLLPSGEAGSPHQYLFTEQMLPDTMNAALLFTLLVTILKSSDSEHEQLFIYESLKEGVLTMPEAFPVVYDILLPKMAQVIQNSQNEQIIDACLSIMKSIFSSGMESTVSKKRLPSKDYLAQKVGFHGLVDADSFTKPVPKTDALVKIACNVLDQIFTLCGPRN